MKLLEADPQPGVPGGNQCIAAFCLGKKWESGSPQGDVRRLAILSLVDLILLLIRLPEVRKQIVSLGNPLSRQPLSFFFTLPWAKKYCQSWSDDEPFNVARQASGSQVVLQLSVPAVVG